MRITGRDVVEVAITAFKVVVESGRDRGRIVPQANQVKIGTDASCDLVLTDETVSRSHAVLTRSADGVRVEDLESRNGTWLNGARVKVAFVPDGGLMQIGATQLRIHHVTNRLVVVPDENDRFEGLLGQSKAMRETFALARQLARFDFPVAITGETGTGKELLARALHEAGPRRDKKFLVLDCGNIVPDLLRAELFGHEKGAFTGADRQQRGILEEADGGTVLLDEVGELGVSVQPQLLRALETREVTRLGGRTPTPVQVRIVSATHRDLRALSETEQFRHDLYYRLTCVSIRIPPLRERPEDIMLLTRHFMKACAERNGVPVSDVSAQACSALERHDWLGNVRELRNCSEALCALSLGRRIEAADVQDVLRAEPVAHPKPRTPHPQKPTTSLEPVHAGTLAEGERTVLERVLLECGWNRREAARRLGISPTTLYAKINRFGLKPNEP
jgi:two-component system response regulator GlrR